jgi:hypothetical protein
MAVRTSEWQTTVLQALAEFLTIEDTDTEWHVKRPTTKAYKTAVDLISQIPPAKTSGLPLPRISPDRQGGIQFEWEKSRYAVEISVSPTGTMELLRVSPRDEEEGRCSLERAAETLLWLSRV